MSKRAAIYARYSTDLQDDKSIADQFALCRAYAKRESYTVVGEHHDAAKCGASIMGRYGLQDMLVAAYAGKYDAIIVEHQDRLSRDQEDTHHVYKRLKHHGVKLLEVHGGEANTLTVGMKAIVAEMYREDNAKKVRRGMAGLISNGKSAGGRAYGYQPHPRETGRLEIIPAEAAIITEIYTRYGNGDTPRQIAADLNARGVAAPRGKRWAANTLIGNGKRGSGILANCLYRGVRVWNRVRMLKDPDTGRRVSRSNDAADWQTSDLDETIRVISDDLWSRVQAVKSDRSSGEHKPGHAMRAPKRLLSGLLKCGACGGGMGSKGRDRTGKTRIHCTRHAESGDCPDPRSYYLDDIEADVIARIAGEFRSPRVIQAYIDEYQRETKALTATIRSERDGIERRIATLDGEARRSFDLLAAGVVSGERAEQKLRHIEAEIVALKGKLASIEQPVPVIALHPTALASSLAAIETLRDALASDGQSEAARLLRAVIDSVTLTPTGEAKHRWTPPPQIEILGKLESLIGAPAIPSKSIRGMNGSGGGT